MVVALYATALTTGLVRGAWGRLLHAPPSPFRRALSCDVGPERSDLFPTLNGWILKALDSEERRRNSLQKEAQRAQRAEQLGKWGTLVVSNLYRIDPAASTVVVEDWEDGGAKVELSFDPQKGTPQEQADAAFAVARKLRRGSKVIEGLLTKSEATMERLAAWREAVEANAQDDGALQRIRQEIIKSSESLGVKVQELTSPRPREAGSAAAPPAARPPAASPRSKPTWTGRRLTSPAGIPILVGRNRRENELLSLMIARHPDVWMHARGTPGAHVVLRVSEAGRNAPTDECMQMAANLAAFYSDSRGERKVIVTYTSPKHVRKLPGSRLGTVQLRQEDGTWMANPDEVPEEVKIDRDRFSPKC
mmetsp:Transcript_8291/g.19812  ORF Transcript_8291/g.19812 Transcript_8291/m.19812 type:complete len:363 (+) Transcript_8291:13-1101(+)